MREQGSGFVLSEDGVHQGADFMRWDDIEQVFYCNMTWNGAAVRELRIADGHGRALRELASAAWQQDRLQQHFENLHHDVVERVAPRQWRQLLDRIERGQPAAFLPGVTMDDAGVRIEPDELIPWTLIAGHRLHNGQVWLDVLREEGRRDLRLGNVAQTANLPVMLALLDHQRERYGLALAATETTGASHAGGAPQAGWSGPLLAGAIGIGLGFGGAWSTFDAFKQLESGQVESIRVAAPIAWMANLGPPWFSVAKWSAIGLMAAIGCATVVMLTMTVVKATRKPSI